VGAGPKASRTWSSSLWTRGTRPKPSKADGRTFTGTCDGETARVEDDNIDDGGAVLELDLLGQHRRDLVILPLVLWRYVEQEYKYLQ
jgi:hypothetical protein